jgi:hypothetical protein
VKLTDFPSLAAAVDAFKARDPAILVEGGFHEPDHVPVERADAELTMRERDTVGRPRKAARS